MTLHGFFSHCYAPRCCCKWLRDSASIRAVHRAALSQCNAYSMHTSIQLLTEQVTQQVEVSGHKALASQKAAAATAAAANTTTTSNNRATTSSGASSTICSSSSSGSGAGTALLEARTLCVAELCRILHRLFQLDQSYAHACAFDCRWEVSPKLSVN
jgi:hypothetical protein